MNPEIDDLYYSILKDCSVVLGHLHTTHDMAETSNSLPQQEFTAKALGMAMGTVSAEEIKNNMKKMSFYEKVDAWLVSCALFNEFTEKSGCGPPPDILQDPRRFFEVFTKDKDFPKVLKKAGEYSFSPKFNLWRYKAGQSPLENVFEGILTHAWGDVFLGLERKDQEKIAEYLHDKDKFPKQHNTLHDHWVGSFRQTHGYGPYPQVIRDFCKSYFQKKFLDEEIVHSSPRASAKPKM